MDLHRVDFHCVFHSARVRAFHQLLGNFLVTSRFFVSSNFLHSEPFLQLSSNSEISEQLLVFKLAFLPYFTMCQQTIYEFPVKKEPNLPPWGRSWAQNKSSQAARSADFRENSEWWTKIHPPTDLSVSGEECHSTIYWLITFFGFN